MSGMVQLMEAPMRLGRHPLPELALSPAEVRVLIFLGDKGETIMTELAAAIDTPLSTVTRIADRLERKGLIVRSRSDRDRRIVVVTPSGKGKKLHDAARQDQLAMAHRMLELLSPDEREAFLALVAKLARGLQVSQGL
ncbi:MAG TPA: MarR family transcriptional regulator [Nitrospirota bacterium]